MINDYLNDFGVLVLDVFLFYEVGKNEEEKEE